MYVISIALYSGPISGGGISHISSFMESALARCHTQRNFILIFPLLNGSSYSPPSVSFWAAASHAPSAWMNIVPVLSIETIVNFSFVLSYPKIENDSNSCPPNSPFASTRRKRPPRIICDVSVPFVSLAACPGIEAIFVTVSHVPAIRSRILWFSFGFPSLIHSSIPAFSSGFWSSARTPPANASAATIAHAPILGPIVSSILTVAAHHATAPYDTESSPLLLEESGRTVNDSQLAGPTAFPTTCWSQVILPARGAEEDRRAALDRLAAEYWRPVYAYVRARWAKSPEDARDVTQEFFLYIMEGDFLSRVDRERGRFRAVLKVALANFVTDAHRRDAAEKRGGGRAPLPLGDLPRVELPDPRGRTPDDLLDDAWRREVLATGLEAVEESYRREGKETTFEVFRDYFLSETGEVDYASVAARHGISTSDVSNRLTHAKGRYRETIRRLVAETVRGEDDLREELAWLFGGAKA